MNQYILHHVIDYSVDMVRLKVLGHTSNLFWGFYGQLRAIKNMEKGGFMYIKYEQYYSWNCGLFSACSGGHLDLVNLMIEKGADDWDWGLGGACRGGLLDLVNLMMEKGGTDWTWGLRCACSGGHLDLGNLMIEKGATDWNWALFHACLGGHPDLVNLMISKGATRCSYCDKSAEEHLPQEHLQQT
jgi:hypothetical protein